MNPFFEAMNQPVSSIMTSKLLTVIPTDSLKLVEAHFEEKNIHHLPVVRHNDLVGLISKSDFDKVLAGIRMHEIDMPEDKASELMLQYKAEDLMVPLDRLVTVSATDSIGTVSELFLVNFFHAIPVVNEAGEIEGIVTSHDMNKYFYKKAYPED